MKLKSLMLTTSAALLAVPALAQDMADEMTIVSWGGAYQNSQLKAYVEPYQEMHPEVQIIWDESSAEAVAGMRAQSEAGNITWDLVDVTAADSMRLCDEGLAMEIDPDEILAEAPDGTPASEDFGEEMLVSDCFIPQIAYSYTFGYRTDVEEWEGRTPDEICDVFNLEEFPGQRSLEKRPHNNMEWALYLRRGRLGGRLRHARDGGGAGPRPRQARHDQGPDGLVDRRRRHAAASGGWRSGAGLDL